MARKVLVGMLLLGALFIFGLATFYVENWQRYLGKGYPLRASFPLVHTLDVGDIVRMSGVEVGAVEELTINTEGPPENQVEAILRIDKRAFRLTIDGKECASGAHELRFGLGYIDLGLYSGHGGHGDVCSFDEIEVREAPEE